MLNRELPEFRKLTKKEREAVGLGRKPEFRTPEESLWEQADRLAPKSKKEAEKRGSRGDAVAEWE